VPHLIIQIPLKKICQEKCREQTLNGITNGNYEIWQILHINKFMKNSELPKRPPECFVDEKKIFLPKKTFCIDFFIQNFPLNI